MNDMQLKKISSQSFHQPNPYSLNEIWQDFIKARNKFEKELIKFYLKNYLKNL